MARANNIGGRFLSSRLSWRQWHIIFCKKAVWSQFFFQSLSASILKLRCPIDVRRSNVETLLSVDFGAPLVPKGVLRRVDVPVVAAGSVNALPTLSVWQCLKKKLERRTVQQGCPKFVVVNIVKPAYSRKDVFVPFFIKWCPVGSVNIVGFWLPSREKIQRATQWGCSDVVVGRTPRPRRRRGYRHRDRPWVPVSVPPK